MIFSRPDPDPGKKGSGSGPRKRNGSGSAFRKKQIQIRHQGVETRSIPEFENRIQIQAKTPDSTGSESLPVGEFWSVGELKCVQDILVLGSQV